MNAVLQHIDRAKTGAPTAEQLKHDEIAKSHFLKYCDTGKCICGNDQARTSNWHDNGFCVDCTFNPYNMQEVHHE